MNLKKLIETKHPDEIMGAGIGRDGTDHLDFFCPKCNKAVDVVKIFTRNIKYDKKLLKLNPTCKPLEKCTWLHFYCKSCNLLSYLKFYWTDERTHSYWIIKRDGNIIKNGVEIK